MRFRSRRRIAAERSFSRTSARRGPQPAATATTACSRSNDRRNAAAAKLLSCIYRVRELPDSRLADAHVVDVLRGERTEKVRWYHERLSTFGIGKDRDRRIWRHLADELLRLGLIAQDAARHNVVALTEAGRRVSSSARRSWSARPLPWRAGGASCLSARRGSRRRGVRPGPVRRAADPSARDRGGAGRAAVCRLQRCRAASDGARPSPARRRSCGRSAGSARRSSPISGRVSWRQSLRAR